ncbi:hypothetical protein ACIG0C_36520 [Kitasatospora aureofaciens]|uniref:hypothetical protein n=1 Tax=Kitasatospora aureofaciens TaxID=1894 RepID=UPI00114D1A1D|nr:hypothetical protein [Kitasatospora aureofaciens]
MNQSTESPLPLPLEPDRICNVGDDWLFVPDRINVMGDAESGYLAKNGERVVLRHCSRNLAELIRILRQLEFEFSIRMPRSEE